MDDTGRKGQMHFREGAPARGQNRAREQSDEMGNGSTQTEEGRSSRRTGQEGNKLFDFWRMATAKMQEDKPNQVKYTKREKPPMCPTNIKLNINSRREN